MNVMLGKTRNDWESEDTAGNERITVGSEQQGR